MNWSSVFIVGWSSIRGVMLWASALVIPLTLANGSAFPQHNLILFITFVVVLSTLILQGLSLPLILKCLKLEVSSWKSLKLGEEC